jgi:hypothetical protein
MSSQAERVHFVPGKIHGDAGKVAVADRSPAKALGTPQTVAK